jgi:hypothetical protein
MKAKLLKISVMTIMVIFLFAGASWADSAKNRHHKHVRNKHIRTEHDKSDRYREPSHNSRRGYEHPRRQYKKHYVRHPAAHRAERHAFNHDRRYHRPVHKHDPHRRKVIRKHYHKRKPSYNVFSFRVPSFEPGWAVTFKTKNRW